MSMRCWPAFLLVLLAVPAVGASQQPPGTALERTLSQFAPALAQGEPALESYEDAFVAAVGIGDADSDGHDDLLVLVLDEDDFQLFLHSGSTLGTVLWQTQTNGYDWELPVVDIDGDGVTDLVSWTYEDGTSVGQGQGTPVGGAYAYVSDYPENILFRSGRDRSTISEHVGSYGGTYGSTYASGLVASGGVSADSGDFSEVFPIAPGALLRVDGTYKEAGFYAGGLVTFAFVDAWEEDVTLTFMDAAGAAQGSIAFEDTTTSVRGVAFPDLTGDGRPDLVATIVRGLGTFAYAEGQFVEDPVSIPEIVAHASADGAELWRLPREGPSAFPQGIIAVGDVDGDGTPDLGYVETRSDPAGLTYTSDLIIIHGAAGTVLSSLPASESAWFALPYGDVDGDGAAEMLLASEWGYGLRVVDASLQTVWELEGDGYPLNYEFDDGSDAPAGPTDWTGDGTPDLLMLEEDDYDDGLYDVALSLLHGRDGATAWNQEREGVLNLMPIGEMSGTGRGDVAVIEVTGDEERREDGDYSNSTVTLEVLRGEDGSRLWTQVLRDPRLAPMSMEGRVRAEAYSVGDLDGDGLEELAVVVEENEAWEEDSDEEPASLDTVYLFASGSGRLLASIASAGERSGGSYLVPAEDIPASAAPPLPEGVYDDPVAEPTADAKAGVGVFGLVALALLGAVAVARRRA